MLASVSAAMLRQVAMLVLLLGAFGFLAAGVWLGFAGDGDTDFGIPAALLCMAPMLAVLALAMRFGLFGGDDE